RVCRGDRQAGTVLDPAPGATGVVLEEHPLCRGSHGEVEGTERDAVVGEESADCGGDVGGDGHSAVLDVVVVGAPIGAGGRARGDQLAAEDLPTDGDQSHLVLLRDVFLEVVRGGANAVVEVCRVH